MAPQAATLAARRANIAAPAATGAPAVPTNPMPTNVPATKPAEIPNSLRCVSMIERSGSMEMMGSARLVRGDDGVEEAGASARPAIGSPAGTARAKSAIARRK